MLPVSVVVVRLFAIYIAFVALQSSLEIVWTVIARIDYSDSVWEVIRDTSVTVFFAAGLPLLFAFAVWRFAKRIAGADFSDSANEYGTFDAAEMLTVGLALIGVLVLVNGLIDLVATELWVVQLTRLSDPELVFDSRAQINYWFSRIEYVAQIALGAGLIAGKRKLSKMILRLRYGAR